MSGEAGGERGDRRDKQGGGGLRQGNSAHQDVSLQEQPGLDGDADAGLAVSLDIAMGERGAENKRAAEGGGQRACSLLPLPQGSWEGLLASVPQPSVR